MALSRFIAGFATPFIVQTWRPEKFEMGRSIRQGSVSIGLDFGTNIWKEFWPDLRKKAFRLGIAVGGLSAYTYFDEGS